MMNPSVTVVGAGLAGCEAAWQCALRGARVTLYEMKPLKKSPAHKSDLFCELVCSNSLRAEGLQNAIGLLKEELLRIGSGGLCRRRHGKDPQSPQHHRGGTGNYHPGF